MSTACSLSLVAPLSETGAYMQQKPKRTSYFRRSLTFSRKHGISTVFSYRTLKISFLEPYDLWVQSVIVYKLSVMIFTVIVFYLQYVMH